MPLRFRNYTLLLVLFFSALHLLLCFSFAASAAEETRDFTRPLSEDQKLVHALNRLAYGPRPGDIERVKTIELMNWIEAQLHPETIDDKGITDKLSNLPSLNHSPQRLLLAHIADSGLLRRARQIEEEQIKTSPQQVLPAKNPLNPQQLQNLTLIKEMEIEPRASFQALGELQLDKLARAVESERQLYEILVDFWSNHFNLDVKKGAVRTLKIADERTVIRPHIFGSFRELLEASAKSPAMLIYLDNVSSTRENRPLAKKPVQRGGINENYARELLELHTLGVDGGYTQKDVQEVARCFTGWGIDRGSGEFLFRPRAHDPGEKTVLGKKIPANGGMSDGEQVLDILSVHPSTAKFISRKLCMRLIADQPPQSVIDRAAQTFLTTQGDLRATVKTIVTSPEFFSAGAYRAKTKSPLEYAVSAVRALGGTLLIPNPNQPAGRAKLIADGITIVRMNTNTEKAQQSLARQVALMGQPLYSYQAPTGYSEDSRIWVSTGALVARINFALDLLDGKLRDVTIPPLKSSEQHSHNSNTITGELLKALLNGEPSESLQSTLQKALQNEGAGDNTPSSSHKIAALILGSPDFQRR